MLAAGFRAPDPVQLPLPFSTPLAAAEDEADEELLDCRRPPELPPLLPLTVPAPLITLALPAAALGAPGPIRLPLPISTLPAAEVEADEELLDCSGPPELPLLLPLTPGSPGSPSASAGLSHARSLRRRRASSRFFAICCICAGVSMDDPPSAAAFSTPSAWRWGAVLLLGAQLVASGGIRRPLRIAAPFVLDLPSLSSSIASMVDSRGPDSNGRGSPLDDDDAAERTLPGLQITNRGLLGDPVRPRAY